MINPKIIHKDGQLWVADLADDLEPPILLGGDTLELGLEAVFRNFDFAKWVQSLPPRRVQTDIPPALRRSPHLPRREL